jgi:4'-phosphopantetheinyl transferase
MPGGSAVHVWLLHLDLPENALTAIRLMLGPRELERADRFRLQSDRLRFIAAHGGMRSILGAYLGCKPHEVDFQYDGRGKPAVHPSSGLTALRFNLSYSGDFGVLGAASQGNVGVDIEQIRPMSDLPDLARSVLSPQELAVLRDCKEDRELACFFQMWTRKEAIVKATGTGLSTDLPGIRIDPAAPAPDTRFRVTQVGLDMFGWSFTPAAGYEAAVVAEGWSPEVTYRIWPASE